MLVPPGEKIMETKSCKSCGADFAITDRDLEFYDRVSPVFNGKKEHIPTPTLCPDCRQRRRLAFRNERKLYKRKCDLTGKDIVSIYSPDKPYKVYEPSAWWGDGWDALEYGREFDFGRTLGDQFASLLKDVPALALASMGNENGDYANYAANNKNCYLVFASSQNEDCLYGKWLMNSKNLVDCLNILDSHDCYECVECQRCTGCFSCRKCFDCFECVACVECVGCSDCIGCSNLRNKRFCIGNVEYSEEEYHKRRTDLRTVSVPTDFVRRYATVSSSERVLGDNINHSKDICEWFDVDACEGCKYVSGAIELNDSMDIDFQAFDSSRNLEVIGAERISRVLFSPGTIFGHDQMYSLICTHSSHLFACVGLRHKQYCILNKQYTEEEYNILVPKIIAHMRSTGEWGEFFSPSISPFGYNETIAQEYFPLTKEEAIKQWFNWSDYEPPFPKVDKIIPASKLPERIEDIPDDILNWAVECEITKKPFRIIKQELEFYRKHHLPIPRRHPDQRHLDRLALRNPRKLHERNCDNCGKHMITTYAPDRPERVYCEECYRREVYG